MNVITFVPRDSHSPALCDRPLGQVLTVSARFAQRAYPVRSWVRHAVHGEGEVLGASGHMRTIRFERMHAKLADELLEHEIPDGVDRDTLVEVAEIQCEVHEVHASELQLLLRVALPFEKRWAYS